MTSCSAVLSQRWFLLKHFLSFYCFLLVLRVVKHMKTQTETIRFSIFLFFSMQTEFYLLSRLVVDISHQCVNQQIHNEKKSKTYEVAYHLQQLISLSEYSNVQMLVSAFKCLFIHTAALVKYDHSFVLIRLNSFESVVDLPVSYSYSFTSFIHFSFIIILKAHVL